MGKLEETQESACYEHGGPDCHDCASSSASTLECASSKESTLVDMDEAAVRPRGATNKRSDSALKLVRDIDDLAEETEMARVLALKARRNRIDQIERDSLQRVHRQSGCLCATGYDDDDLVVLDDKTVDQTYRPIRWKIQKQRPAYS